MHHPSHSLHTAFDQTNTMLHLIDEFNPYTDIENVHYYLSEGYSLEDALMKPVREVRVQVSDSIWDHRIKSCSSMLNGVWK